MKTATFHLVTAREFARTNTPLSDSLFAHYAHSALSTANMAHVYNYLLVANVSPMDNVERHVNLLAEAERAYDL